MVNAVYCLSSDEHRANAILTALRAAGFTSEISVLLENDVDSRDMSLKENATRGAKAGSVVGALLALTLPGIGPALAIGPILAALTGAAAGGAVGGLIGGAGALSPLGLPEDVSKRMHEGISNGEILIAVQSNDAQKLQQALDIFHSEKPEYIYETRKAA